MRDRTIFDYGRRLRAPLFRDPGEDLPDLVVNPKRDGRHEPRAIKDLQDTYRKMTKPRDELRKALRKAKKEKAVKN